jgi:H+-translocating NAD(P) transhydrogenase subunit alpha
MIIGVPAESYQGERRVALVPTLVSSLTKAGFEVVVEAGAGRGAGFPDTLYKDQGARIAPNRVDLFSFASIILQVSSLAQNHNYLDLFRSSQIVIGLLDPLGAPKSVLDVAKKGATSFSLELLPRISRAQSMDVLTSMATISGYKSVLLAAGALGKMFPMMITAAGTITPARVLVLGAGVAGLQAIASSRRLGAVVLAYDIRPAVKEQVESLGGHAEAMGEEFYKRQRDMMTQAVAESDVVISTAAVPGKKAPVLVTKEMVVKMRPGSVIVDLAAEGGGNCELTRPGERVEENDVTILGPVNLPSTIPYHASQMYSKNVSAFLLNLVKDREIHLNLQDQIIRDTLVTHQGEVTNPLVRQLLGMSESTNRTDERSIL